MPHRLQKENGVRKITIIVYDFAFLPFVYVRCLGSTPEKLRRFAESSSLNLTLRLAEAPPPRFQPSPLRPLDCHPYPGLYLAPPPDIVLYQSINQSHCLKHVP